MTMILKNVIAILFCALYISSSQGLFAQEKGKTLFNDYWQFAQEDKITTYDEAASSIRSWREVTLPHDWSVEGPFSSEWASGTGFLPGGIGWYKKTFSIADYDPDKSYTIYFDGVYKNSEVWINGHHLGKRPNGFLAFHYDLSPYLKASGNELYVKADHREYADSRYYTGSGIYRNVYLITQEKQRIQPWGVFFTTPEITANRAKINVQVAIQNDAPQTVPVDLNVSLQDAKGNVVGERRMESFLPASNYNQETLSFSVPQPQLWSTEAPYLYELKIEVFKDGESIDYWEDKVGLRSFRFDAQEGFFLNGENMLLKGVCIHHDAGALGAAVPKAVWKQRLTTLKELGCNAIRMSHYPHQDYLYDLCDEMGFLVQDEAFDEWEVGKNKWIEGWNVGTPGNDGSYDAFKEWGEQDVRDMVLRARNHPSIIMWSVGNEIDYPNDPYSHPVLDEGRNPQIYGKGYQKDNPSASRLGEIAGELVSAVKAVDTSRPVTAALAGVTMSNHTGYPDALDIVGYNYQEYRYEEDHGNYPNRVIYGSENGDALEAWLAVTENSFISSQFLWTAFDFLGEARPWPARSSGAGIIDLAGYPKSDFYFRKSLWNEEPMVYLAIADKEENVHRRRMLDAFWQGNPGDTKWVACYANVEEVELWLNGKSLGTKEIIYDSKGMPGWKVEYVPGELKAVGYEDGKEVATFSLNTPGSVDHLEISSEKGEADAYSGDSIVMLDISLSDRNGNLVPNSDQNVRIGLEGDAELLGLESGDLRSHEDYQASQRKTYKGRLKAYIKIKKEASDVNVVVESGNLSRKLSF
ncbi:glycoside hydrolase family 2 TIM barrel-domain containing protein [Echinicola rosea]|nr:glycoside hydrolase family 2 TIM barrel-domain containing protein [Echinicola rosea]